jgi:hypothetical protein
MIADDLWEVALFKRHYGEDGADETIIRFDGLLGMIPKLIAWERQEFTTDPFDEEVEEEGRRAVVEELISGPGA